MLTPRKSPVIFLIAGLFLSLSCAKSSMSERDAKREQLRSAAETKRNELKLVAGLYHGALEYAGASDQSTTLLLEIKDIPTIVEGGVDPVPVPTLKGYLKLNIGGEAEFEGFSIEKADFDPKRNKLDLVGTHAEFKEMVVSCRLEGTKLVGTWTSPSSATTGTLAIDSSQKPVILSTLRGSYQGALTNTNPQSNLPERLMISLVTSQNPADPNSLVISGSLRLYIGPFGSNEYVEDAFSEVSYNVFTRRLIAKSKGENGPLITLNGFFRSNVISGTVYDSGLGEVGKFEVNKQ